MFVVFNWTTGWSDESMRFATRREAEEYIFDTFNPSDFDIRVEA